MYSKAKIPAPFCAPSPAAEKPQPPAAKQSGNALPLLFAVLFAKCRHEKRDD